MGIIIKNIYKSFAKQAVLDNLSLTVKKGEFHVILGPSGEGKSTLLGVMAGLIQPDQGDVYIQQQRVNKLAPEKRKIGFVFQNHALFPHLTVYENTAYGLRARGVNGKKIKKIVAHYLELVKLQELHDRYPFQLSGGQKQRTAIARALAFEPDALLMDEPLSHLDVLEHERIRDELKRIQTATQVTICYVTHDHSEAAALADKISILHNGRIEQVEQPEDIFYHPKTSFVAEFVGANNIFTANLIDVNEGISRFRLNSSESIAKLEIEAKTYPVFTRNTEQKLCLHPEKIAISHTPNGKNSFLARIIDIIPQGAVFKVTGEISGLKLRAVVPKTSFKINSHTEKIWFTFPPDALHPLCGRSCRAAIPQRVCKNINFE
ncbi:MAG: ABC transporter ATP-binding protein [Deltaproteobacteria bacterium]|nr:ABC transporter ATP-binding protein [Deltaproteobacteria bacterium]